MLASDFLDYHASARPDALVAVQDGRSLTYGAAARDIRRLANGLRALGLATGARFGYIARNDIDTLIVYQAASKSGLVPVPLNWRLAPPEWAWILADAGASALISQGEFLADVDSVRSQLPALRHCLAIDSARPGWIEYRPWLAEQSGNEPAVDVTPDHVLYQMYTSGTTGRPKGALLTHRAVISNAMQTLPVFGCPLRRDDRTLIVMPLFHAGATSFMFGTTVAGACMEIHAGFDPLRLVDALSSGVTKANLVPAMLQMAMDQVPDVAERDYERLDTIIYGASPIAENTLRRALAIFDCEFYQGYGQTESSACLTMLNNDDHRRALTDRPELLASAGRALPGTALRIVDADGTPLPPGRVGEVLARGPQLMRGYWNLPEATGHALAGGWLHTGDAGWVDAAGYLYISDRVKDMIISGGENIYPREVENVLFEHPAIRDAAVIGVPDDRYGEAVLAVVVLKDAGSLTAAEIEAFCRRHLAGYKVPRQVEFVDTLPRNPSGKLIKAELREPYWRGRSRSL